MDTFVDESDPDTSFSQLQHALQSAEAARKAGEPRWLILTALIHDLGKMLSMNVRGLRVRFDVSVLSEMGAYRKNLNTLLLEIRFQLDANSRRRLYSMSSLKKIQTRKSLNIKPRRGSTRKTVVWIVYIWVGVCIVCTFKAKHNEKAGRAWWVFIHGHETLSTRRGTLLYSLSLFLSSLQESYERIRSRFYGTHTAIQQIWLVLEGLWNRCRRRCKGVLSKYDSCLSITATLLDDLNTSRTNQWICARGYSMVVK